VFLAAAYSSKDEIHLFGQAKDQHYYPFGFHCYCCLRQYPKLFKLTISGILE